MTLYDFLVDHLCKYARMATNSIGNYSNFYKNLGGVETCDYLINRLSDESLKIEIITRDKVFKK